MSEHEIKKPKLSENFKIETEKTKFEGKTSKGHGGHTKKKISGRTRNDITISAEIYSEISNKVRNTQTKIKQDSDRRLSFKKIMEEKLAVLENEIQRNMDEDKQMYAELTKIFSRRNVLLNNVMKKLDTAEETIGVFLESVQSNQNKRMKIQCELVEKFYTDVSKFKTSISEVIIQENTAKEAVLQEVLSILNE